MTISDGIVYLLLEDIDYDGNYVLGVFSTLQKALDRLKQVYRGKEINDILQYESEHGYWHARLPLSSFRHRILRVAVDDLDFQDN